MKFCPWNFAHNKKKSQGIIFFGSKLSIIEETFFFVVKNYVSKNIGSHILVVG